MLARMPEDADALRQLGMLAYDENRLADAERLLRRYTARGPDDYEAHYFLGEALTALKRPAAAVPFYRTALAQLRARGGRGDAAVLAEANLLNRLGKVDDAVVLFDSLRKRRPGDRQLKADYASMLIENGRLPEARRVLALP
ncbi:tetratricopeptide repeat protein [Azospirillum sp. INR13]|uniref:tetratricopeptide repeat protein n=1 Tax=Azospirillum sp. INR13 TaxID=2596919 RepID=UPI00351C6598